jgi:hypothetical protein
VHGWREPQRKGAVGEHVVLQSARAGFETLIWLSVAVAALTHCDLLFACYFNATLYTIRKATSDQTTLLYMDYTNSSITIRIHKAGVN